MGFGLNAKKTETMVISKKNGTDVVGEQPDMEQNTCIFAWVPWRVSNIGLQICHENKQPDIPSKGNFN